MQAKALLSRSEIIHEIVTNHGLLPEHIYLLDLIPLIEMVWADGKAQAAEMSLLYGHVIDHLAVLSNEIEGQEVLDADKVNDFLSHFLEERPDPKLLKMLRELALNLNRLHSDPQKIAQRSNTLLGLCMDIAAAAVVDYPYDKHARVMEAEKRLLIEIMGALDISPDRALT